MRLPAPTHTFTIPSVYDGLKLDCRLYHPLHAQNPKNSSPSFNKAAIIAHPYAPFGGCRDDPVIAMVGDELLSGGYIVGTFNLRGAGESKGRTSWTGKPELGDFISFYGFILFYIMELKRRDSCHQLEDPEEEPAKLILSGYSYGSMLATFLPPLEEMKRLFGPDRKGGSIGEIKQAAHRLSSIPDESSRTVKGLPDQAEAADLTFTANTDVSYLLISPILPPLSLFAAMGLLNSNSRLNTTVQGENVQSPDPQLQLTRHRTLSIYGDEDSFTSHRKLQNWSQQLHDVQDSLFKACEVKGAGHFWREKEEVLPMRKAIRDWITTVPPSS